MKNLKEQFNNIKKIKCFEIEVIDNRTKETTYILFDISLNKNTLVAQHESLNSKQSKSKKIAYQSIVLDKFYSLDSHLESLYDKCINAINESEYFSLV